MDGPGDDHIKWSNSDREKQISYDIAYMQNLKKKLKKWYKWTYLQNINKLTNIETRDQIYGYQGNCAGRDRLRVWDWHAHTALFKIDGQQGPPV